MNTQLLTGICIALGAMGTWNAWTLHQLSKRLDAMEQGSDVVIAKKAAQTQSTSDPYQPARKKIGDATTISSSVPAPKTPQETVMESARTKLDLSDPDIQEAIAQIAENNAQQKEERRRRSKMEAYKTSMKHELERFSTEKEYDSDTVQSIESILNESTAEWRAVREQVREGEISWMDARTELKAIGEDTEAKVTEFISAEDYKELRSRLWGDWGR